ncbi:MAG: hypothetical protein HY706_02705 [Candidatus Hydrogenedentes bacterium]|nr:hypothetical protein [Candidatus Hydrogenedentota bacterium]
MRHIQIISCGGRRPAPAVEFQELAKFVREAIGIVDAIIDALVGFQDFQRGKSDTAQS